MSLLDRFYTKPTLSAEQIADCLEDANIADIRHRRFLGATAYGDMLDASDEVLSRKNGLRLMALLKVTRSIDDIKKGSVVSLHVVDSSTQPSAMATYVLSVDTREGAVAFNYPLSSEYIASRLVAAHGLRQIIVGANEVEGQPSSHTLGTYPDNHVVIL